MEIHMKNSKTMAIAIVSMTLSVGSVSAMQSSKKNGQKSQAQVAPQCPNGVCDQKPSVSGRYGRILAVTKNTTRGGRAPVGAAQNSQEAALQEGPAPIEAVNALAQVPVVDPVNLGAAVNGVNLIVEPVDELVEDANAQAQVLVVGPVNLGAVVNGVNLVVDPVDEVVEDANAQVQGPAVGPVNAPQSLGDRIVKNISAFGAKVKTEVDELVTKLRK